jgi:tRNA threonylcarbamoyl adenosine modification protein YeaZ
MLTLILETSNEKGCLILAEGETPIAVKTLPSGPELSKRLALEVQNLIAEHKATLQLIAVGTGPGSYTGIRVGAALAKTLSYGWGIPLIGFCSLKGFAPPVLEPFAVLVDARMGGFYALLDGQATLISPTDPRLLTIPHIASPHPELIKKRFNSAATWHETEPNPALLAKACFKQFLEGEVTPLELSYLTCP